MKFAAIIFDMDGVLVDSEPMHVDAMRELLRPYGIPYTDSENEEFFGFTDLEVFERLRERYGLEADPRERTVPMPGIPDVPRRLRALGYRLAVASSSASEVIEAMVEVLGLAPVIEGGLDGPLVRAPARGHVPDRLQL